MDHVSINHEINNYGNSVLQVSTHSHAWDTDLINVDEWLYI